MHSDPTIVALTEYAAGRLYGKARKDFESHLTDCTECTEAIKMYRLLERAVEHPSSERLAIFAVEPNQLPKAERSQLQNHLAQCPDCNLDIQTVTGAVTQTRASDNDIATPPATMQSRRAWAYGAIAATVLIALTLLVVSNGRGRADGSGSENAVVVEGVLSGTGVREAGRQLDVRHNQITAGAEYTFRSGESIALGNGVSVDEGAQVRFEIVPQDKNPADSDAS